MIMFKDIYDPKNDKYEFYYDQDDGLGVVFVSGGAMRELAGTNSIARKHVMDIGNGVREYLKKDAGSHNFSPPIFVLQSSDPSKIENEIRVNQGLVDACSKWLELGT